MPSSKPDTGDCTPCAPAASASPTRLVLSESQVVIRSNGLEFLSPRPLSLWAEVSVDLQTPAAAQPVSGRGVVVDCAGTRSSGYVVSLLFLNFSEPGRQHLQRLARATVS